MPYKDPAKTHEATRRWKLAHRAQVRAYHAEVARKRRRETPEVEYAKRRRYEQKYPERHAAHQAVYWAIRRGKLVPQPCERCGAKAQAHHDNYNRPLDVRWLCQLHHQNEHHQHLD